MKRIGFNTKVGTSRGLGAYRNKGSDYLELSPKYRTLCERGRTDVISASIDYSAIPSCASSGYMPTAKIWKEIDKSAYIWNKSAWLHADINVWTRNNIERTRKVFDYIVKEHGMDYFNDMYTPVFYDNIGIGIMKDFATFAQAMFDTAGKKSMELYNYAFRTLKDGRNVLYARNGWLRTFKSGLDIINYYKMASKRNFKKVYGF